MMINQQKMKNGVNFLHFNIHVEWLFDQIAHLNIIDPRLSDFN